MPTRYRSRRADERGAVAVMVAIMLVLLMSMAAFGVDTGNGWRTRPRWHLPDRPPAPAAAETYAQTLLGRAVDVRQRETRPGRLGDQLRPRDPRSRRRGRRPCRRRRRCTTRSLGHHRGRRPGRPLQHDRRLRAAAGLDRAAPAPRPLQRQRRLRPVDRQRHDHALHRDHQLRRRVSPGDCGANVPGNWGVEDFDGGANSNSDTRDWIENEPTGPRDRARDDRSDPGASHEPVQRAGHAGLPPEAFQLQVFDSAVGSGKQRCSSTSSAS